MLPDTPQTSKELISFLNEKYPEKIDEPELEILRSLDEDYKRCDDCRKYYNYHSTSTIKGTGKSLCFRCWVLWKYEDYIMATWDKLHMAKLKGMDVSLFNRE